MGNWSFDLLIFILLIIFLTFIIWTDWILKCRKIARENKLNSYAVGYAILMGDENGQAILVVDGLLGANQNELVFGSRFKDDAMYFKKELSDARYLNVSEFNENEFLKFVHKNYDENNDKTIYIIRNMMGLSTSKHIPKLIRTRMICKISFDSGDDFYFCYKNTIKNVEAIENIKKYIRSI